MNAITFETENYTTQSMVIESWTCGFLNSTELLQRLSSAGAEIVVPLCIPPILLGIMAGLYVNEMIFLQRQKDLCAKRRTSYAWSLSAFPMIGLCCVLGLFIPAAGDDLTVALNFYFGICVKKFFELNLDYYGGKEKMAEHFGSATIDPNPFPCCFVICCCRNQAMTLSRLKKLHIVVNQVIYVYPIVIFVKAILKADGLNRVLYGAYLLRFLDLVGSVSNFTALYPFVLAARSSRVPLRQFFLRGKYLSLQLLVAFNTIQRFTLKVVVMFDGLDCHFPYPNNDPAFLYHSYILVFELFLLSLLGWYSFKRNESDCKILPYEGDASTETQEYHGNGLKENGHQNNVFIVKVEDDLPSTTKERRFSNYVVSDAL